MGKEKFYVVWKGHQTGIFTDWKACEAQVKGFAGAQYKAFETRAEAERAFASEYAAYAGKPASGQKWLFAPNPPIAESYVVDAACSGIPGPVEWRGVHLASGRQVFHQGPLENGTNNIGEFLAIVHALALLEQQNLSLPVYSDSSTAIAWVEAGKCKTDLLRDEKNALLFDLIARAEAWLAKHPRHNPVYKWDTQAWGEIPADFNRK